MKRGCSGHDISKGKRKSQVYVYMINAWKTFWDINKLTIVCSETPLLLCKNQSNDFQCKIAGFQTDHIFSEKYFEKGINPCPANVPFLDKPGSWFLLAKCTKHLWKSDI